MPSPSAIITAILVFSILLVLIHIAIFFLLLEIVRPDIQKRSSSNEKDDDGHLGPILTILRVANAPERNFRSPYIRDEEDERVGNDDDGSREMRDLTFANYEPEHSEPPK